MSIEIIKYRLVQYKHANNINPNKRIGDIVLQGDTSNGILEYIFENGFNECYYGIQQLEDQCCIEIKIGNSISEIEALHLN